MANANTMKTTKKPKSHFKNIITVYGQNSVQEALENSDLDCQKMHVAVERKDKPNLAELIKLAKQRNLPISLHKTKKLAQISKNSRQDQGIALDVRCPKFQELEDHLKKSMTHNNLVALDGITNPKNVGIIIRSATAAGMNGVLYPRYRSPQISPLVIQSSAGTVFKAPIIRCNTLEEALKKYLEIGFEIVVLDEKSSHSLFDMPYIKKAIYVLGGESSGSSFSIQKLSSHTVSIPMRNDVESLNVAAAASILFYSIKQNSLNY
ncbi:MAG: 23S rRNA (guanosine(2251)-2'-O)-methyltransferase RlmB [Halieaceae bacterium]|nr:23S rRNA (guanosine(2251)-2'-O)-methyltransferase RlmB [Halieaceae bacterium]